MQYEYVIELYAIKNAGKFKWHKNAVLLGEKYLNAQCYSFPSNIFVRGHKEAQQC